MAGRKKNSRSRKRRRKITADNSELSNASHQISGGAGGRVRSREASVKDTLVYTIMYSPVFIKRNFNQSQRAEAIKY